MHVSASGVGSGVDLPELLPGLETVAHLRQEDDAHRRVDRVALLLPPRPQLAARAPERLGVDGRQRARPLGRDRSPHGCGRQDALGIVHDTRVAALGLRPSARKASSASPESSAAAARARPSPIGTSESRDTASPANITAASRRRPCSSPRSSRTASTMSSALPIASPSGCDMSVTAARVGRPQSAASAVHASASSAASSGVFMNAPLPAFTSRSIRSVPIASFFDITLVAISGNRRHRGGGVPERVQRAVGRHEVGGLRRHRRTDLLHLAFERVGVQVGAQARDRLELVERAARVSEPAAGELGHREPERRRDRREDQGHTVGNAARRVLVDLRPRDALERERRARVDHRARERERLRCVQAVDERRHQEGGGQVVGDLTPRVGQDEGAQLVGVERTPVALGGDKVARVVHAPISDAKLEPCRSHGTPRSSATVAPRSAYVSRSPTSNGPPSSPAPSSGVRSRE